jgi:hypothetical protein
MEKKPKLVPYDDFHDLPLNDGGDDNTPQRGYVFYDDAHKVVSKSDIQRVLDDEVRKKYIKSQAIKLFTELSDRPELTKEIADDFFTEHLGLKVVEDGNVTVYNNVSNFADDQASSVVILPANTIDQFAGMFWSNLVTFGERDIAIIRLAAIDSMAIACSAMAFYEHLLGEKNTDEKQYIKHVRAARKLLKELVGLNDIQYSAEPEETKQIFAGIAFRSMIERLKDLNFGSDPGIDLIESKKGHLCLKALRATEDEFFVGIASAKGEELTNAYIKAVVNHKFPRSIR